jgi:transglutaminase-like putative cysteine protease
MTIGRPWADAYVEDLGWVSFDPSNRTGATQSYIRIAIGLDYAEGRPHPRRAQRRRG